MNKQYMDHIYNDAQGIRKDREFVADQYNMRQKENFKHRVATNFKLSEDSIILGIIIGVSLMFIFKVWVFWSIISAFFG